MQTLPEKLVSSPHLEAARLRLRNRFRSKFPIVQATSEASVSLLTRENHETPVALSPHLEDTRNRLRSRFHEKFPTVASTLTSSLSFAQTVSTTRNAPILDHLEAARARISHRFQQTFQPDFGGFPHTLSEALASLEDESFGKKHAVIITTGAPNFHILAVNSSWENLCGFSSVEAVGKTIKELGFSGSMTSKAATRNLTQELEHGKPTATHVVNRKKDGHVFTNYLRATPLFEEGIPPSVAATAVAFLGVVQDVSSRQV